MSCGSSCVEDEESAEQELEGSKHGRRNFPIYLA